MITCVYLACKIEETYFGADELARQFHQNEAQILATERQLLESLNFQFVTYSPYRSLSGLVAKLADAGALQGAAPRELEGRAQCGPRRWPCFHISPCAPRAAPPQPAHSALRRRSGRVR